jgi:hypothetical protein
MPSFVIKENVAWVSEDIDIFIPECCLLTHLLFFVAEIMNAYSVRYERFKGKAKKGGSSWGGPKVPKKAGLEKPLKAPPPPESIAAEVPSSDPLASSPPPTISVSDFVDLRDEDEGEEDGEPVVFQRKRKMVEDDAGEDDQAQAKHAKKGKGNGNIISCYIHLSI